MSKIVQRITASLWFTSKAEEAIKFYTSIFKDSKINRISYVEDRVMSIEFQLEGQPFVALNGGQASFTSAISFIVNCKSQEEIDYYWEKLTEGADEKDQMCGWLKDRFGVSWQIVPYNLSEMMCDLMLKSKTSD